MPFTWNEKKRRKNMKDHQHDFADAEKVFHGLYAGVRGHSL
jgi:uncharacterized DUF497 family protein